MRIDILFYGSLNTNKTGNKKNNKMKQTSNTLIYLTPLDVYICSVVEGVSARKTHVAFFLNCTKNFINIKL